MRRDACERAGERGAREAPQPRAGSGVQPGPEARQHGEHGRRVGERLERPHRRQAQDDERRRIPRTGPLRPARGGHGAEDERHRQPEPQRARLRQRADGIGEVVGERDDRDAERGGAQQPRGPREAEDAVAGAEPERGERPGQQAERAVADRRELEPGGQQVDARDAVLRGGRRQHRVAVQDLVRRAEQEVVVELDDPGLERGGEIAGGGRLRAEDQQVRHQRQDREEDERRRAPGPTGDRGPGARRARRSPWRRPPPRVRAASATRSIEPSTAKQSTATSPTAATAPQARVAWGPSAASTRHGRGRSVRATSAAASAHQTPPRRAPRARRRSPPARSSALTSTIAPSSAGARAPRAARRAPRPRRARRAPARAAARRAARAGRAPRTRAGSSASRRAGAGARAALRAPPPGCSPSRAASRP